MSDTVISVEDLSKRFFVGHDLTHGERYASLREVIGREVHSFARKAVDLFYGRPIIEGDEIEEFWALKNLSFNIKRGEIVGVIGRNGAGKSTLLKILSRITEPTRGRVELNGRVASLLEIGTGFHPELTGRENIFLNGAILGMKRREIEREFDEIVSFAEVERFLDMPVKRYSSGMYLRLAFAVAAHLNPEILLVDEVLAVGDAEFQKKCLGKLEDVTTNRDRTVVFVSHNMSALLSLCKRGILIDRGTLVLVGGIKEVVDRYFAQPNRTTSARFEPRLDKPSITEVAVDERALKDGDLIVDISFRSPFALRPPVPGIVVSSNLGIPVFGSNPRLHNAGYTEAGSNSGVVRLRARGLPLASGQYLISVWLGDWHMDYDHKEDILSFDFRPERAGRSQSGEVGYLDWAAEWCVL